MLPMRSASRFPMPPCTKAGNPMTRLISRITKMEPAEIEKIYSEGKAHSHAAGLMAVFSAGVNSVPVVVPQPDPVAEAPKAAPAKGKR